MLDDRSITGRYLGLFLLGCFLFSYPILTIFNLPGRLFGIPLFFLYLFAAWLVLIVLVLIFGKPSDTVDPLALLTGKTDPKKKSEKRTR